MASKSLHPAQKPPFNLERFSPNLFGLLALILAVVAWAIAANVANHLFLKGVQPLELAGASAMIATFGLALLDCLFGRTHAQPLTRQNFALGLVLVGLVGADYLAIQRLPVAVAIVLLFAAPVLVVLWKSMISRSLPARPVLVALSFAILGVLLVSNLLATQGKSVEWEGVLIGLSTAIFFAAYIVLNEQVSTTPETIGVMLKTFAVASLFWLAYQFTQGVPWRLLTPENLSQVIGIGIAGNLLPYLLFFWSVQRVQAERAAIAATLEPVIAGILAWIWFGQTLTIMQMVGGFLIAIAVTWLQFHSNEVK